MDVMKLMMIALGGAIGALMRYSIAGLTHKYVATIFPIGTLTVNLTGCLLIGFLWQLFDSTIVSENLRIFLLVGLLGAFTTFSTFGLESLNLLRDGEIRYAALNIIGSVVAGLVCVFIGVVSARFFVVGFR